MKILLTTLNSKYVHSNPALRYLYSASWGLDAETELKEFTINNEMGYIYTEILRGRYDLVCFSCYIWNIDMILRLGSDLKKAKPRMKILLGGPEVSYESRRLMEEHLWIDYILRGEGEVSFPRFCRALMEGEALSRCEGLTYRMEEEICENADGCLPSSDQIPFLYSRMDPEKDKVVYYESSRGCPYRCSYCLSSLEKGIRALPLERVKKELDFFLKRNVKQVKFIDRTFNYDRKRAAEIWRYLMEQDNGVTNFHFEICGELLDDESLRLLEEARDGLFQFEIGIQTVNPQALAAVDRNPESSSLLKKVKQLIELGNSHIHVDLIAGLPFEDYESFGRSFDAVYSLCADNLQLGFLKMLKGTKIRRQTDEYAYVFRETAPYEIISNRYLAAEELVKLKMIEHVLDLYANKGGFSESLAFLQPLTADSPFRFYEVLAEFFYKSGYQHRSHKKEDLYRILNRFGESLEKDGKGKMGKISESLRKVLSRDLENTMNFDAVKKFHKKGWDI